MRSLQQLLSTGALGLCLSLGLSLHSLPAWAGGIAIVDFQEAINQVEEGEQARQQIDALFKQKEQAIAALETQLKSRLDEYEKQRLILSADARAQKEQEIMQLQQQYQQAAMQAEMEMQQAYNNAMENLIIKMRAISETIGAEKGYDLVLEVTESGVVFNGPAVIDITPELIRRYNAGR